MSTSHDDYVPADQPNTLALIGFILSVLGFFTFITAIPGVILSHMGLKQIRQTRQAGHGLAVAGLVIGYSVIGLSIFAVMIVLLVILVPMLILGSAAMNGYY